MAHESFFTDLLATIDATDAKAFGQFLTPDARFRFGNNHAIVGREAVEATVAGFFAAIKGLSHRLEDRWMLPELAICTGLVTYTRRDGSTLQVPFANVMKLRQGRIHDYQIFIDNSALFGR